MYTGDYPNSNDDTAAFIQEWLWFGLLSEFLEQSDLDVNKFTCTHNGRSVVTTKYLPYILTVWCRKTDKMDVEQRKNRFERVNKLLQEAKMIVSTGISYSWSGKERPVSPEIALSIQMLGFTLSKLCTLMLRRNKLPHETAMVWGRMKWAVERLLNFGWCPSALQFLTLWFPGGHYYLALLGPLKIQKDHTRCTEAECNYDQLNTSNYPVKHVHENCNCRLLTISPQEIAKAIDDNMLPLIQITDTTELSISLVAVEFDDSQGYTAISHVWGDGLGSPTLDGIPVNGLAECQISRLFRYVRGSERNLSSVRIWMDTFCIPAQTLYIQQRRAAIGSMRTVYTRASKVLVLDAELLQACAHVSNLELLIRILSSGWMRRVWTLQEGALNKATYVQFSDGVIDPAEVSAWCQHDIDFSPRGERQFMFDEVAYRWQKMTNDVKSPKPQNLVYIYDSFQFRRTSHATDEAICLAVLSDMDTQPITEIVPRAGESEKSAADRRMKEFLTRQRVFPTSILCPGFERFDDDGFRWAPKSFIRPRVGELNAPAISTSAGEFRTVENDRVYRSGLYCRLPGLMINMPDLKPGESIIPNFGFYCTDTRAWYYCGASKSETVIAQRGIHELNLKKPAMLLVTTVGIGALVDITEEVDGWYFAKYISQFFMIPSSQEAADWRFAHSKEVEKKYYKKDGNKVHIVLRGAKIGENQKWCIY